MTRNRSMILTLLLAMLLPACTLRDAIAVDDLPSFVLATTPKGMTLDSDSGGRTLEDLTLGDEEKAQRYRDAGFRGAYEQIFTQSDANPSQAGLRLISGAILFEDATAGIDVLRQTILEEGDAKELVPLAFAPTSYAAKGTLDLGLPPGYLFVWPHGEVVMFVAAVAFADVREQFLRDLAQRIDEGAP